MFAFPFGASITKGYQLAKLKCVSPVISELNFKNFSKMIVGD
jgi:hypothetical protein